MKHPHPHRRRRRAALAAAATAALIGAVQLGSARCDALFVALGWPESELAVYLYDLAGDADVLAVDVV